MSTEHNDNDPGSTSVWARWLADLDCDSSPADSDNDTGEK